jgi:dipeptidyl aminopeptidase/acylaminoacyl peptidase
MGKTSKRALELEDLFRIAMISDPHISPTGTHVAWVETRLHNDDDTYKSAIWIADIDGGSPRKLTSGLQRDGSPVWSSDGKNIAFISNRKPAIPPLELPSDDDDDTSKTGDEKKDGKKDREKQSDKPLPQVWVISIEGGEAEQVTNHPTGAGSPTWSPDGTQIAFVADDKVTKSDAFKAPVTSSVYADERVINDLRYRFDGRGWLESFSHIWTANLHDRKIAQRTFGDANDSEPAWSPNGSTIAFTRSPRETTRKSRTSSIFLLNLTNGEANPLLPLDGAFSSPVYSPDGRKIAFEDGRDPMVIGQNIWLGTVNVDGTDRQTFDGSIDLSLGDYGMSDLTAGSDTRPRWIGNEAIATLVSDRGTTHVHRLDLSTNKAIPITSAKRRIMAFDIRDDALFFVAGEIHRPTELYRASATGSGEKQVTTANAEFLAEVRLAEAIDLEVIAPDGQKIQAWLLPPHDLDPKKPAKYPLIVQIHGGPHSMYAYAMFHEMQLMAAKNYGVVFCNPRGSAGYGESFTMCTRGTWGESDMPDVMVTLDKAIEEPWVDTSRLGVTGGSYGGYLTNWIIGHTDRFKAAVTQRCVSNFHSFFGTSDIGFDFGTYQSNGVPWADSAKLLKYSPITYVDKIRTPLLILHSEQDLRCPIEQAEQMFVSLRYLGQEVGFVRIPEEGHELSRSGTPSRRLARLQHLIGWFDTHL